MHKDPNRVHRRTRRRRAVLLAVLLLLVLAVGVPVPGIAAPATLEEAVAQVERTHGGRILSARSERRNGQVIYVIRLLTEEQQVRNLEVQGAEGARP